MSLVFILTEGKVHRQVAKRLRALGIDPQGLAVTSSKGYDHTVLLKGKIIGTYNHKTLRVDLDDAKMRQN